MPVDVQEAYDAAEEMTYDDSAPGDVIATARRLPEFQTMMRFSQAPFWKATPVPGGMLVELMDLRYGTPDNPGFAAISSVMTGAIP